MKIAKANEKHLQAELLEQNGALLGSPSEVRIFCYFPFVC